MKLNTICRLVATNENGSSYATTEFTTISLAPLVKIKQTVDVTETTAILYGQVNPNSLSTSFYFEYGTTPAFGLVTPTYPLVNATEFLNVSATVIRSSAAADLLLQVNSHQWFCIVCNRVSKFFHGSETGYQFLHSGNGPHRRRSNDYRAEL